MRAWRCPAVPALAASGLGHGPAPVVHDTARDGPARLDPPGRARLYVCGITPYDATHLGHAATYVAFDLLQRVWRDAGLEVSYTQNVTDIDDPLLERATRDGVHWRDLAEREVQLFRSDMEALRVLPPDHYTGVVESMDLVVDVIDRLHQAGATYLVDGDVYFSVHTDDDFGKVSGLDAARMRELFAERGGDPDRPGKRDPLDWLLWRAERPGEPAWDSPLGRGRPGWHVECSAMAVRHLGMGFEVQGGGSDLIFPHHEMSAAEAQVAFAARPFAQAYVHAGMVGLGGEKMSKSRGNLVLVSRLREDGADPMAIRLALLAQHYRRDWQWTGESLPSAVTRLARWRAAAHGADGARAFVAAGPVVDRIRTALADDLDAPAALAVVDDWAEAVLTGRDDDGAGDSGDAGDAGDASDAGDVVSAARSVSLAVDALLGVAL